MIKFNFIAVDYSEITLISLILVVGCWLDKSPFYPYDKIKNNTEHKVFFDNRLNDVKMSKIIA